MKYAILAAALVLALNCAAWATTIDRVVAVVNNEIITSYQLEKELRESGEFNRHEVLERLIREALELQRAEELGIRVPEEELEAAIRDVQRQNDLTRDELEEALLAQGLSFEEYRENLRRQILFFKLIGQEVQARVEVTTHEIRDFYQENLDEFREEASMRLSHISFPLKPKASIADADALRTQAEEARARLRAGDDFHAVLQAFSARGAVGGEMGNVVVADLSPSFARAVRDLNEGEFSTVIENAQGFHLLKVNEITPGSVRDFETVRDEISAILNAKKTQQRMEEWSQGLRKKAYIEVRL